VKESVISEMQIPLTYCTGTTGVVVRRKLSSLFSSFPLYLSLKKKKDNSPTNKIK